MIFPTALARAGIALVAFLAAGCFASTASAGVVVSGTLSQWGVSGGEDQVGDYSAGQFHCLLEDMFGDLGWAPSNRNGGGSGGGGMFGGGGGGGGSRGGTSNGRSPAWRNGFANFSPGFSSPAGPGGPSSNQPPGTSNPPGGDGGGGEGGGGGGGEGGGGGDDGGGNGGLPGEEQLQVSSQPEPSSIVLLILGGLGIVAFRRRTVLRAC